MSGTVATTIYTPEALVPLERGTDGRILGPGQGPLPDAVRPWLAPQPINLAPAWLDQETLIPGLRNMTVVFGAGLAALGLWWMTRKTKAQVIG